MLLSFPRDQSLDVTPGLREGGWFLIFDCTSPFCFLLIEFHCFFFISYIVLTCYVYYYCIWLGFNMLLSCFLAGFQLFSPKGSVTGCDSSLTSFCYTPLSSFRLCIFFRLLLLRIRSNRCAEALVVYKRYLCIGLLLSKEIKQPNNHNGLLSVGQAYLRLTKVICFLSRGFEF